MEQALELALDRADDIIESVQQRPPERKDLPSGKKSVSQKLYDIYIGECEKEPEVTQDLRSNVNLLEKLVEQEKLPCLVVNLYPGNEGYSLMIRGKHGSDSETIQVPYEQGELLEYLDAEELPPVLVDLLEKSHINMFHSGCVVAEIRDYRQCSSRETPGYQSRHILLRPTMQTLISDVNSITSDNHKWNQEDKLLLESQVILATAEPLCLDPSVSVACTANKLLYNKQKMNTPPMKQNFKRYSWTSLNRQQELSHCPPPPQLLVTSSQQSEEGNAGEHYHLKISKAENCVDMWKESPCNLAIPSEVDVEQYVKVENSVISEDSQLTVWPAHDLKDDYEFECEAGSQYEKARLTIMQSLNDPFISGKTEPWTEDEDCGSLIPPCHSFIDDHSDWFMMGSKADFECGLSQYQELVQKEAKSPAKMPHSSSGSASLNHPSLRKKRVSVKSSVTGKGVKRRRQPTRLPSSSATRSSSTSFTAKQASSCFKSPIPPASEPPHLSWKLSVNPSQASMPSPATQPPASSSQRATNTQVMGNSAGLNLVSVVGSVGGTQTFVSGSNPVLSCTPVATTPVGISLLPSGGPLPNAVAGAAQPAAAQPGAAQPGAVQPGAVQPSSQGSISLVLKNTSNLRPLTLLQLPRGSFILNTLPQQPQQLSHLAPQQPLQQPTAFVLQQPGVQHPQQGSASQGQAVSSQPAVLLNFTGVGTFVQSQPAVLSQPGSSQKRPQQSLPQPQLQFFPAFPQQQQQVHQLRIVQLPVAASAAAAAPAAQPLQLQPQHTGSQAKGKMKGGKLPTPKS